MLALLLTLCLQGSPDGQTYYVDHGHPNASDLNSGKKESVPWKTIVHAGTVAGYGDTVLIKDGEEYQDGNILILGSGGTYKAYPGDTPIIRYAGILGVGVSDVVIDGLTIMEAPGKGIRFEGRALPTDPAASGITIRNCHTYDTCSSGISIWGIDGNYDVSGNTGITDVLIENNLVELGTHGCYNEIITIANGAEYVTVRYNEIRVGDPAMSGGDEGIDFKRGVRYSSIYGNLIWDLSDKAIYIDGGEDFSGDPWPTNPLPPPVTSDILIYNNVMFDLPSAGIVITTEGRGIVRDVLVYNNLVYDVDGDAFRVYDHPDGHAAHQANPLEGLVEDVLFVNNTAWNCGLGTNGGGGFRVNHHLATGIVFRNNIGWDNISYDFRGETGTTFEYNLGRDSVCTWQVDPLFVSEASRDFHLQSGSQARDVGSATGAPSFDLDWLSRPAGPGYDLGCYEFQ